ncbi:spermatogenesis-associated serine-rich protein 2 isoform X7 [Falco naumanni]|uniref:spermatogenesis-associated serine-rich protein 2 isoform X7 n=1 Tax=Falco naumanni TaxID=148594 RepID=UPI001ADE321A|nr:spermatogenesis-associated serine-rich protein 2 isoform X7 [Falco naumanni]
MDCNRQKKRTRRRKPNRNPKLNRTLASQSPVNWCPLKKSNQPTRRRVELTVSMSTAVPTTRSPWTRSAKVWMRFRLMPESWRIASPLRQTCLIEQSPSSLRQRPEQRSASRSLSRSTASNSTPASLSVTRLEDVPLSPASKKLGSNIEKSVKDLQRCTVSLARYRVVVKEEMDASIKKMKQAFAELQSSLMDREVALLAEMDKVKAEAMEILVSRQKKAEALKKLTDVAVRMSEEQLVELRADIKHFVSERKYDEDLGRVARFTCDLDALKKSIASFGQDVSLPVSHPKNSYSTRSRCSSVTAASLSGPSETPAPSAPACASASAASLTAAKRASASAEAAVGNAGSRPPQPPREAVPGQRRAAAGPKAQGQRHIGPPGRYNGNRQRNRQPPPACPRPPRPASARATAGAPPLRHRDQGGAPPAQGGAPPAQAQSQSAGGGQLLSPPPQGSPCHEPPPQNQTVGSS